MGKKPEKLEVAKKKRKRGNGKSQQQHISEEILFDILLNLPSKSLMRFKAVSKSWRSLIMSPEFVNARFLQANQPGNLKYWRCAVIDKLVYPNPFVAIDTLYCKTRTRHLLRPESLSKNRVYPDPDFVGSCNGVLLIRVAAELVLWNPITSEYRRIHSRKVPLGFNSYNLTGLCYDSTHDDFKVVILNDFKSHVYSSKSDSWKPILLEDFIDIPNPEYQLGSTVNGSSHWVANRPEDRIFNLFSNVFRHRVIFYFDPVTEKFEEVPPPTWWLENRFVIHVGVLGGCLTITREMKSHFSFDVWSMTEYGVKESWTKLFTISDSIGNMEIERLVPLCYKKNIDEVLLYVNGNKVMTYNLRDLHGKCIKRVTSTGESKVVTYTESLLFPSV